MRVPFPYVQLVHITKILHQIEYIPPFETNPQHTPPHLSCVKGFGFHFETPAVEQDLHVGNGVDGFDRICRLRMPASVISSKTGGKVEGIRVIVERAHLDPMQKVNAELF